MAFLENSAWKGGILVKKWGKEMNSLNVYMSEDTGGALGATLRKHTLARLRIATAQIMPAVNLSCKSVDIHPCYRCLYLCFPSRRQPRGCHQDAF